MRLMKSPGNSGIDIDKVIAGKIVEHSGATNTFETFFEQHLIKPV